MIRTVSGQFPVLPVSGGYPYPLYTNMYDSTTLFESGSTILPAWSQGQFLTTGLKLSPSFQTQKLLTVAISGELLFASPFNSPTAPYYGKLGKIIAGVTNTEANEQPQPLQTIPVDTSQTATLYDPTSDPLAPFWQRGYYSVNPPTLPVAMSLTLPVPITLPGSSISLSAGVWIEPSLLTSQLGLMQNMHLLLNLQYVITIDDGLNPRAGSTT